jgi:type II secretory pathway pseudopilin PulG
MNKSFTIIEMMIIITIIAVLSGIAIPQYKKYVRKAETSIIISMLNEIKLGEVIYYSKNGSYLEFGAAGNNTNSSKLVPFKTLGISTPQNDYDYYVGYCDGINPGIILRIRKQQGPFIYLVYPSFMTLSSNSDRSMLSNGFFINDYINDLTVSSGKQPQCYTASN